MENCSRHGREQGLIEEAKHQSSVSVVEITDPTASNETIEVLDQDVVHLESAPLLVRRVTVPFKLGMFIHHSVNNRITSNTRVNEHYLSFTLLGPTAAATLDGLPLDSSTLVVGPPDSLVKFIVEAGYESMSLLIYPEVFASHLRKLKLPDQISAWDKVNIIRLDRENARALYALGSRIIEAGLAHPDIFLDDRIEAVAYNELLESLIAAIGSNQQSDPSRSERRRSSYSNIIKTCEAYTLSKGADHWCVADLCATTRVSERTLQYAFNELLDMSPKTYLTRLRLHRARQELRTTTDPDATVTAIAMNWGFWHFGDFARIYKDCFAQPPSRTLKENVNRRMGSE